MFVKRSRYYKLSDVITRAADGVRQRSKGLRLTPQPQGRLLHTLESDERLDQLAYKYYRQSLHWWHICDANEFSSPLELTGTASMRLQRYELRWEGFSAPWQTLLQQLRNRLGVDKVLQGDADIPVPQLEIFDNSILFNLNIALQNALSAAVLSQQLPPALDAGLQAQSLVLSGDLEFSQPGAELWRIRAPALQMVYQLRINAGALQVSDTVSVHDWVVSVQYNHDVVSSEEMSNLIETLGFDITDSEARGRAGKKIVIPPRFNG